MRKYLHDYIESLEKEIYDNKKFSINDKEEVLNKIHFFQHERLIHLLVTLFFAFLTLSFMVLGMLSYLFLIPFGILIVFLIFYIFHYFYLENGVQYLYKLYDKIR